MAKKDDLSVNIGVGVKLDKDSVKETNDGIDSVKANLEDLSRVAKNLKRTEFSKEVFKELGFGPQAKIRVGGYSSPAVSSSQSKKAARKFEKLGGDFNGAQIADEASAAIAKEMNLAAQEFTKRLGIDFVKNAAEIFNEKDFIVPDSDQLLKGSKSKKDFKDKLQKGIEDFFVDAAGSVFISPAMLLAAVDRVLKKNNPDVVMPGNPGADDYFGTFRKFQQFGVTSAGKSMYSGKDFRPATGEQKARFDKIAEESIAKYGGEKMGEAFLFAVGKDFDEIILKSWQQASAGVLKNKDIQKILASDPTFNLSGIAAEPAMENLQIYTQEKFLEDVLKRESEKGYDPKTFASNLKNIISNELGSNLLDASTDDMNVIPKDLILNWLSTIIEDNVATPIQQVLEDPAILGKGFIASKEGDLRGAFTKLIKKSSGEDLSTPKQQAETEYNKQVVESTKKQMEAAQAILDQDKEWQTFLQKMASERKQAETYQEPNKSEENAKALQQEIEYKENLIDLTKRSIEESNNPDEIKNREERLSQYREELALLKEQIELKQKAQEVQVSASAETIEAELIKDKFDEIADQVKEVVSEEFASGLENLYEVISGELVEVVKSTTEKLDPASKIDASAIKSEIYDEQKQMDDFLDKMIAEDIGTLVDDYGDLLKNEFNQLDEIKRQGISELSADSQAARGGSLDPNLDLLRKFLVELKQSDSRPMAAMDTEYFTTAKDSVTELGIVVTTASGKIVEVLKFLQAPTDMPAFEAAMEKSPDRLGQAKNFKALSERAEILGIPKSSIGSATDPAKNAQVANENYRKLVEILDLFAELEIPLTGSNFKTAEINNITKSINYINEFSKKLDLDLPPIKDPNFKRVFDPAQAATKAKFSNQLFAGPDVAAAYQVGSGKVSGSLDTLMNYIAKEHGDWLKQFEPKFAVRKKDNSEDYTFDYMPTDGSGKPAGAHIALADAAASGIIVAYFERFGSQLVKDALIPISQNLEIEFRKEAKAITGGADGGSKGPTDRAAASADEPSDRSPSQITDRLLLTAKDLNTALEAVVESLIQPESVLFRRRQELLGVQGPLEKSTNDRQSFVTLQKMTDAENAEFRKKIAKNEEHLEIIKELTQKENELAESRRELTELTQGDAAYALGQINQVPQDRPPTESELAFITDGGIERFYKQADAVAKLKNEVIDLTKAGRESEIQTAKEAVEEMRKGKVTEQLTDNLSKQIDMQIASTQAGKTATAQIKAQMQEQINSQKEAQRTTQNLMNTWVTSRYALYDIGNFYTNIAQRLFGLSKQIFDTGQSFRRFETAFTSVERAMQLTRVGAKDLTEQFIKLSEEIPVTFEDIARIATLGAQMGINADGVVEFTKTVAEFSSITGMSAETVAQQFGRVAELADVDSTEYRNLGSAVAFAGINAVATEEEILKLAVGISAVSNQAGFSAKSIIGISTALASVAIPAEQARGVFTRVFAKMDRSVSEGTRAIEKLNDTTGMTKGEFNQYDKSAKQIQAFARMAGLSADEFSKAWGPNGQSEQVFYQMLEGLNATTDLTKAFDELGIVNVRDINTLTRLSANLDVVRQALEDSGIAFEQGVFLGEAFQKTVDNVDSKLIIFKNNVDSLAAAFSQNLAGGFGLVLDKSSEVIKFIKGASDSFAAMSVLPVGIFFTIAAAGAAAFLAVTKKLTAQLLAFRVALVNAANDPTGTETIVSQVKQLLGLSSGMMEVRDQISGGFQQRGLVQPFTTKGFIFQDEKKLQAELLKTNNIYYARGKLVEGTEFAASRGAQDATHLARLEADQVRNLIEARQLEIESFKQSADMSVEANAKKLLQLQTDSIYIEFKKGEARAIDENTFSQIQNTAANEKAVGIKNTEAQARQKNIVVVNAETSAAAKLGAGMTKFTAGATKLLAVIGIITAVASTIDMLSTAIRKANEIDLIAGGGGLESLREAIKEDTLAVRKGTMEAIATAQVEYKSSVTGISSVATAIKELTGLNEDAVFSTNKVTDAYKKQNVAIAENTREWLANALYKTLEEEEIDFTGIQNSMKSLGLDFDKLIEDMVAAASGEDINPLAKIESSLDALKRRREDLEKELPKYSTTAVPEDLRNELIEIYAQIDAYEELEKVVGSLNGVFEKAFSQDAIWNQIKNAFGIKDIDNSILDLIDTFKEAVDTGKGMEKVMGDIKSAVVGMLPEAYRLNEALMLKIDSETTVMGLIEIVKGLIKARQAAVVTSKAFDHLGTSAFTSAAFLAAFNEALDTEELNEILRSLQALAAASAVSLDDLGGAAESAADRLSRLISEANAGVRTLMSFRSAVRSLGKSLEENSSFSFDSDEGIANVNAVLSVLESIDAKARGNFPKAIREMQIFKLVMQDMGAPSRAIRLIDKAIKDVGGSTNLTAKQAARLRKQFANLFNIFSRNMAAGAAEVTNDVKDQIKTLTDFVSDLGSVLKSAFDVRYGKQIGIDAVSSAWMSLKDAAEAAEKAVKSANDEINQSLADRSVLQYQLSVAERYKDEKRSVVIRAKLAKLDNQIVEQQKQLADANAANDKSLTGGTKAAIDNRAKVRDLVTQYNSYLIALANTGMTSTALIAEATKLETEFMAQAKALGFAEEELKVYTQAFKGDFTKVINGLPRDITLSVNTDPALRAIEEFVAKAQAALSQISMVAPTAPVPTGPQVLDPKNFFRIGTGNTRPGPEAPGITKGDTVTGPKGATWVWRPNKGENGQWDKVTKKAMGGFVSGPGSPTSDSIPAMLSNGEYVIQAASVNKFGKGFLDSINAGVLPGFKKGGKVKKKSSPGGLTQAQQSALMNDKRLSSALATTQSEKKRADAILADKKNTSKVVKQKEASKALSKALDVARKVSPLVDINMQGVEMLKSLKNVFTGNAGGNDALILGLGALGIVPGGKAATTGAKAVTQTTKNNAALKNFIDFKRNPNVKVLSNKDDIAMMDGYVRNAAHTLFGSYSRNRSQIDNIIKSNSYGIKKGTSLVRVANEMDTPLLKLLKPGQAVTLDRFMSATSSSSREFLDGMARGTVQTGGRRGGPNIPLYPMYRFKVKSDIPGIEDINKILPNPASNVVDSLIARGQNMKLTKITTNRTTGQQTYHFDIGKGIRAKIGFEQLGARQYNQDMIAGLIREGRPDLVGQYRKHLPGLGGFQNRSEWMPRYFAKGGMVTGPGGPTSDSIPTMLSSGEFVIKAASVKTYGQDFFNALNQQKVSFAPAGQSFSQSQQSSSVVYLSPEDRALLRAAVDRPVALYTENTKIAQSANAGNVLLAQRGTN